jgi:hypothetical protein
VGAGAALATNGLRAASCAGAGASSAAAKLGSTTRCDFGDQGGLNSGGLQSDAAIGGSSANS